ncbi:hypothetical protein VFPBJ_00579 [Purpureocillium lilacinum]|uniref:Uncharacterized protein n=1 Tax=Purpureocillium lilacinum TaxID=33203 RepID=A0A179HAT5_PURLI|nr:hypothetical protein VFPBJ_00579 [Purpureocillium lilacinum]
MPPVLPFGVLPLTTVPVPCPLNEKETAEVLRAHTRKCFLSFVTLTGCKLIQGVSPEPVATCSIGPSPQKTIRSVGAILPQCFVAQLPCIGAIVPCRFEPLHRPSSLETPSMLLSNCHYSSVTAWAATERPGRRCDVRNTSLSAYPRSVGLIFRATGLWHGPLIEVGKTEVTI